MPLSEARVEQMIASHISQLSSSFSSSMETSFLNIEQLINDRLAHFVSQNVSNPSFAAPSPVPVRQSPSQGRQDPSLSSPRTGYGNPGGEPEEPVQAESAVSSFLNSLRSAGIAVPQGTRIQDSGDRSSSEAVIPAASQARLAGRSQGGGSLGSQASSASGSSATSCLMTRLM